MIARNVALLAVAPTVVGLPPLEPVKPWNLDYADAQCAALRQYGSVDDPTTFAIRPSPSGETFEFLISQRRPAPKYALQENGSVDFGTGPIKKEFLHYRLQDRPVSIHQFRLTRAEVEVAKTAPSVAFNMGKDGRIAFQLRSMPQILEGLSGCTADLKRYWNMDGATIGTEAAPAKGDIRKIFSADDYPPDAQRNMQDGNTQYLLLIDENGSVAGCHVMKASGVPSIDAMGCQVLRLRAKFTPARDRSGKSVRSTYVTPPIIWRIEG